MVEERTQVKGVEEGEYYVSLVNTIQRKKDGIIWVVRKKPISREEDYFVDYVYWVDDKKKFGLARESNLVKTIRLATNEEKQGYV